MLIRPFLSGDEAGICSIYNDYIENTIFTFEETPLHPLEMRQRIDKLSATYPWLVIEVDGEIKGYAYASPVKERSAYRYSAEVSIYLDRNHASKGYGTSLYSQLLTDLKHAGIRTVIACIAYPNEASEHLHKKLGFTKVGQFSRIGYKFSRWLDITYWQKDL
jgi:L-amino acid N-acyltransferase YncA